MVELAYGLFPEPEEPDILRGMPDFTNGAATSYFTSLSLEDRELVQWCLVELGVGPWQSGGYAFDLARDYAAIDPERRYMTAIEEAHRRVNRVERFVDLFLDSTDFFPTVERASISIFDDKHKRIGSMKEDGWGRFAPNIGAFNLATHRESIAKQMPPLFPIVHAFLNDPQGAPLHFNQADISRKAREKQEKPL